MASVFRTGVFSARTVSSAVAGGLMLAGAYASPLYAQEEKPSVYAEADKPLTVVETTTELERQVGNIRRTIQDYTRDSFQAVRSSVNKVVNAEHRVENSVNQLVAQNEPLTPNGIYVGVTTLAAIVFTRYRSFPIRWLTPPLVLAASLRYFMPGTFFNCAEQYESFERARFPAFSEKRAAWWADAKKQVSWGVEEIEKASKTTQGALQSGIEGIEKSTGLRVSSVIPQPSAPAAPAPSLYEREEKAKLV